MEYVRTAYPRPMFERKDWVNLNDGWTYKVIRRPPFLHYREDDPQDTGSKGFAEKINVPFAPETEASGASLHEMITALFYHRKLSVPREWLGRMILLNFGAVFYHAEIYIDGVFVDFHDGGSSSFTVDITKYVSDGAEHDLVVKASSDLHSGALPSGKQSSYISSYACYYQRTTGIWQTVWMEGVSRSALRRVRTVWNGDEKRITFTPEVFHAEGGEHIRVKVRDGENIVAQTERSLQDGQPFSLEIPSPVLWEPGSPKLYDILYEVIADSAVVDSVSSYIGLRTITVSGKDVFINGKRVYQRLVLDQGFYPEGNWTAPSDEALENDIRLSMAAGFNGARLHQKVFEERFFYHADKLGYLVWAETPSWGLDYNDPALPARNFLSELKEIVLRDINHPSIVAWTPLNETWLMAVPQAHRRLHRDAYELCHAIDPTRPVNDASGYTHFITDLWTVHTYEQDPEKLSALLAPTGSEIFRCHPDDESEYDGEPYLVDEFGGIKWDPETQGDARLSTAQNLSSWGYGKAPATLEMFYQRLEGLVSAILSKKHIAGYCYTQLTDVEQEKNGVYFYDRSEKFDMNRIAAIFSRRPEGYDI